MEHNAITMRNDTQTQRVLALARQNGMLRPGDLHAVGAARVVLTRLTVSGQLEKVGRGLWTGVFASFTPFFGLHFIIALVLAKLMRGNMLASLLGTFFGNPLTLVPISFTALNTGYFILGGRPDNGMMHALPGLFSGASRDLWHNFTAMFGAGVAEWSRLAIFYKEVFLPYLVGGIIPGIIAGTMCYMLCVPLVRAYQNRRRNALREKMARLQKNRPGPADDPVQPR